MELHFYHTSSNNYNLTNNYNLLFRKISHQNIHNTYLYDIYILSCHKNVTIDF